MSLASKHITKPTQLRGKTVGDAGIPYQHAYLQTILQQAHVPPGSVKEVNVGSNLVPAMLSGRVDATLGAYWNYEAIQLRQMGKPANVIHVEHAGVPDLRRARDGRPRERRSPSAPTIRGASSRRWGAAMSRCAATRPPASTHSSTPIRR